MDYSQLSDFEINKRVFKGLTGAKPLGYPHNADGRSVGNESNGHYCWYDYCNNPSDAWQIIVANLIEVSPEYDFTDESEQELRATGLWTANHVEVDGKSYYQSHQNPLRAAMIVFLMMQDAKHA